MSDRSEPITKPIIATLHLEAQDSTGEIVLPSGDSIQMKSLQQSQEGGTPPVVDLYDKMTLRVGRARNNDLNLNIPNVSRFHAIFNATSSGVVLGDLASTNGTFLNGSRISTPVDLQSGDVVDIGPARIKVMLNLDVTNPTDSQYMPTIADQMRSAGIVTVLVVDVRGYTRIADAVPPKDLAEMLQSWFQHVSEIVREYGGEVDKYIGDCVMALWRSPEDVAERFANEAVKAAIEIRQRTAELSESRSWIHREQFPWQCRLSLNTGKALIGAIGARGARDFTVLGDSVNVAFRLDGIGSQLGHDFLMAGTTADLVRDSFALKELGPVEVKGKTEKMEVYTLA